MADQIGCKSSFNKAPLIVDAEVGINSVDQPELDLIPIINQSSEERAVEESRYFPLCPQRSCNGP